MSAKATQTARMVLDAPTGGGRDDGLAVLHRPATGRGCDRDEPQREEDRDADPD